MLTGKALETLVREIIEMLIYLELQPTKVILFGSHVQGGLHKYSDVDLAVWSPKFTGEGLIDFEKIRPIIRKHKNIDFKMYPAEATAKNFDPFITVIEKTGRCVYEKELQKN